MVPRYPFPREDSNPPIAAIHGNRANPAGSFSKHNVPGEVRGRARRLRTLSAEETAQ